MALRAHFDLPVGLARLRAHRNAGGHIQRPRDAAALIEANRQAFAAIIRRRLACLLRMGPCHMPRAGAVTGLAADADLSPLRVKAVGRGVVVLAYTGRVAIRAHEVPVLRRTRPVQFVAMDDPLVQVEVEPALSTRLPRPAVPGDAQRLVAPPGKRDEVLLERCHAKAIGHFVLVEHAVRPIRAHEELAVAPKERRGDVAVGERRVLEIPEHGPLVRDLHGQVVMRAVPELILLAVACAAGRTADKGGVAGNCPGRTGRRCRWRRDVAVSLPRH